VRAGFGVWGTAGPSWAGQKGREEGARWAERHGPSADRAEEKGGESGPPGWAGWGLGLSPYGVSISFFFSISNSTQV
jgi:hypothetical protein